MKGCSTKKNQRAGNKHSNLFCVNFQNRQITEQFTRHDFLHENLPSTLSQTPFLIVKTHDDPLSESQNGQKNCTWF